MLYISWMVILADHNIKKIVLETSIFELCRLEYMHKQVVYQSHLDPPPPPPGTQYPNRVKNT